MPKEKIYDAYDPDHHALQIGWNKGEDEATLIVADLEDNGRVEKEIGLFLDLDGLTRTAKTLGKIIRQAGGEPEKKTVRSVAVFDDVENPSDNRLHNLVMTSYAIQQETMNLVAAASGEISDLNPTFRAYKIDTDRIDGKSLWQENKVAYLVEMDYTVEETT